MAHTLIIVFITPLIMFRKEDAIVFVSETYIKRCRFFNSIDFRLEACAFNIMIFFGVPLKFLMCKSEHLKAPQTTSLSCIS